MEAFIFSSSAVEVLSICSFSVNWMSFKCSPLTFHDTMFLENNLDIHFLNHIYLKGCMYKVLLFRAPYNLTLIYGLTEGAGLTIRSAIRGSMSQGHFYMWSVGVCN